MFLWESSQMRRNGKLCLLSSLVWMNSMRRRHSQRSSHWTSVDLHVGSHSEEWCAKLLVVCAPFWSTISKEQGISVLPDTWTTDRQNVARSGQKNTRVQFLLVSGK